MSIDSKIIDGREGVCTTDYVSLIPALFFQVQWMLMILSEKLQ